MSGQQALNPGADREAVAATSSPAVRIETTTVSSTTVVWQRTTQIIDDSKAGVNPSGLGHYFGEGDIYSKSTGTSLWTVTTTRGYPRASSSSEGSGPSLPPNVDPLQTGTSNPPSSSSTSQSTTTPNANSTGQSTVLKPVFIAGIVGGVVVVVIFALGFLLFVRYGKSNRAKRLRGRFHSSSKSTLPSTESLDRINSASEPVDVEALPHMYAPSRASSNQNLPEKLRPMEELREESPPPPKYEAGPSRDRDIPELVLNRSHENVNLGLATMDDDAGPSSWDRRQPVPAAPPIDPLTELMRARSANYRNLFPPTNPSTPSVRPTQHEQIPPGEGSRLRPLPPTRDFSERYRTAGIPDSPRITDAGPRTPRVRNVPQDPDRRRRELFTQQRDGRISQLNISMSAEDNDFGAEMRPFLEGVGRMQEEEDFEEPDEPTRPTSPFSNRSEDKDPSWD